MLGHLKRRCQASQLAITSLQEPITILVAEMTCMKSKYIGSERTRYILGIYYKKNNYRENPNDGFIKYENQIRHAEACFILKVPATLHIGFIFPRG